LLLSFGSILGLPCSSLLPLTLAIIRGLIGPQLGRLPILLHLVIGELWFQLGLLTKEHLILIGLSNGIRSLSPLCRRLQLQTSKSL
jgi:hypothetical protein